MLILYSLAACAAEPTIPSAFMQQLVAGINARDLAKIRTIVHPETLKCMTAEKDEYYAWWLWKDGSKPYLIAADYTITLEKPVDVNALEDTMKKMNFTPRHWPVQPDTGVYINYKPAPMSIMQRLFEITLKDGQARLVMDCPTAEGLAQFGKDHARLLRQKARLDHLWQSMEGQDRQALSIMAKEGMKFDGMKTLQEKYHLNSDEALRFMDMIQYDTP